MVHAGRWSRQGEKGSARHPWGDWVAGRYKAAITGGVGWLAVIGSNASLHGFSSLRLGHSPHGHKRLPA
jgi:hypothetical protein